MRLESGSAGKEESDLDFTASKVLAALRPSGTRSMEYIGTATCDFQAEPLVFGESGEPVVVSDWELNVANKVMGGRSSIKGIQDVAQFPRFMPNKELYVGRSEEIGQNMFRFSLDFGRLCPQEGEFNSKLMAEYVKLLGLIKTHGQEPMVAIYHWPMPRYLLKTNRNGGVTAGGWENPHVTEHFRFYVENMVKFLTDDDKVRSSLAGLGRDAQDWLLADGLCEYFLTLNEPINLLLPPYVTGMFPPYKKARFDLLWKVLPKLVVAHDIARDQIKAGRLKSRRGAPKVGVAHNWTYFDGLLGGVAQWLVNEKLTGRFERGGEYTDFLGLQYYFRLDIPPLSRKGKIFGDNPYFGDMYPSGIYECLKRMNQLCPGKNIFIAEFGFSDTGGLRRPYWILETVRYVIEALADRIPVKGMLLWTLAHNFEWDLGMTQKFGLFSEAELKEAPERSSDGAVKSWEAWQAVARAVTNPSNESLRQLQETYILAKRQFEAAIA